MPPGAADQIRLNTPMTSHTGREPDPLPPPATPPSGLPNPPPGDRPSPLGDGAAWFDRAVVLAFAAWTGAAVVAFAWMADHAIALNSAVRSTGTWTGELAALLLAPAGTLAILWWTRRFVPAAAGSGIPQVIRALDEDWPSRARASLVSTRLALHKIGLVSAGLAAGLSIGREGPTVQIGAGLMVGARRFLSRRSDLDEHDLMTAGAAAGIAAAFNTPLGGIVFALEQLTRRRGLTHTSLVISAIVLAGLVAVAVHGNETHFGRIQVPGLEWSLLGPGLVVALGAGVFGGLFARLLIVGARRLPGRLQAWREAHPYRFAAVCATAVGVIGWITAGQTAGTGYAPTRALLEGQAELHALYTPLKLAATWLSALTGVPAGVFAPALAVGAGWGHDVAMLFGVEPGQGVALAVLGMVGFLAATTQTPITAFIIVMEMVAGQTMVLSLMACALLSTGVSRWISGSVYVELARLIVAPAGSAPNERR
jgi:H+/Cl- antiporter ClcA